MCGIAGFFSNSEQYRPSADVTAAILAAMEKRGPDDSGKWEQHESRVLLMHRRLAIQDLSSAGAQPMHSHDGNLTVVFNGEIYNKEDLRKLVASYPYRGTSDTEVLLALYEKFGSETLRLLRGMYAFAIWDERQQSLFLARDPYGIKPLYIAETLNGVWFASQVKTLLHVPGIDTAPEPAGHAGFFLWGHIPAPYTLYRGIRSLRSGHSLYLQRGRPPKDAQFTSLASVLAESTESPVTVSLHEALSDTTCSHFLADVPIAVFLSAGLDSSTILALSTDAFPASSLNCLTLSFDKHIGTKDDETPEAAQIAEHYGVAQQVETICKEDFTAESQRFLNAMDQPTIDGINSFFIARMARAAGYKVALSGIGGDELFAGYPSFQEVPKLLNLMKKMPVPQNLGSAVRAFTEPLLRRFVSPKYAGLVEYGHTIEGAYLLRRALYMPWELHKILNPDLAAVGLETLSNSEYDLKELDRIRKLPLRAQLCFLESSKYMRDQLLCDADWAGMAHSVEIRTPLVDIFLFSKVAPLLRSATPPSKLDMAGTPAKPLPQSILERKKTGFSVPVREWMMDSLDHKPERGLRSWAKFVYNYQWPTAQLAPRGEKISPEAPAQAPAESQTDLLPSQ